MKYLLSILILAFTATISYSQKDNPQYDSTLAKKYGADDYGMKTYTMVILKTGSNKTTDKNLIDSCFMVHMSNMGKMVEAGKLIVAGPFGKNDDSFRGIFILDATFDETNLLLQNDAAVKEKLLEAVLYKWYGSAALPGYLPDSEKVGKKSF
jgi:hypothetical protein